MTTFRTFLMAGALSASALLVAQAFHGFGRRSDKVELAAAHHFIEMRIFGQKPVARVNGIGAADFRSADNAVDTQIAIG